jgi:hypothetical protein
MTVRSKVRIWRKKSEKVNEERFHSFAISFFNNRLVSAFVPAGKGELKSEIASVGSSTFPTLSL